MNAETNDVRERMQETARMIATYLPPGTGYVLLAFDQGDRPGGRLEYVSNSRREDVARAMLEFIGKVSNTWGTHGTDAQEAAALPSVAGRMEMTHADFQRACQVLIGEVNRGTFGDLWPPVILQVLCEAVRCSRECCERAKHHCGA